LHGRRILKVQEEQLDEFDFKLDRLIHSGGVALTSGRTFLRNQTAFINCLNDLSSVVDHPDWRELAEPFINSITESTRFLSLFLDQIQRNLDRNLKNGLKNDVLQVREVKKCFEKMSDEYDSVLSKSSQIPVSKASLPESEEMDNLLTATRSCFLHTSLDYVSQLSVLHCKKKVQVLDYLSSHCRLSGTYFKMASQEFTSETVEDKLDQSSLVIQEMKQIKERLEKDLEKSHSSVKDVNDMITGIVSDNGIRIQGYLFKRTSNAFKNWNRRWFLIKDNKLMYTRRPVNSNKRTSSHTNNNKPINSDFDSELTVMEKDLRLL